MRFPLPLFPAEFEIPDAWWSEAGMSAFTPAGAAYRSTVAATHSIPLRDIEPPFRLPEVPKYFRGFDRKRMIHILARIAADDEIDPVDVLILPPLPDISRPPFRFRVLHGVHRFYASIAAGFECEQAVPRPA
jgi:hypothetical protein